MTGFDDHMVRYADLPDHIDADTVAIYVSGDGASPPLHATPFVHRTEGPLYDPDTDRKWYDEPDRDEFDSSTDAYRQAVADLTHAPIEDIQTERQWAEPQGYLTPGEGVVDL